MSRALVVGCGYLGRELAERLRRTGWEVSAWTSSAASAEREKRPRLEVTGVDITNAPAVRAAGDREGRLDWVVNCVSSGGGDAERYRQLYLAGVQNLLAGLDFGRLFLTSSTSVYGQTDGSLVSEQSPTEPAAETAKVLLETESIVLKNGGLIARLAGIYGPDRMSMLPRLRAGEATLDGDGSRWMNTIHRDDAALAITHLLQIAPEPGIWNISDDGGVTQRAAYQFLCAQTGLPLPPSAPPNSQRKRGATNKRVSNQKLRATGWQPERATFLAGLQEQLAEISTQRS